MCQLHVVPGAHNRRTTTGRGDFPRLRSLFQTQLRGFTIDLQLYSERGGTGSFTLIRAWEATAPDGPRWDEVRASHPPGSQRVAQAAGRASACVAQGSKRQGPRTERFPREVAQAAPQSSVAQD